MNRYIRRTWDIIVVRDTIRHIYKHGCHQLNIYQLENTKKYNDDDNDAIIYYLAFYIILGITYFIIYFTPNIATDIKPIGNNVVLNGLALNFIHHFVTTLLPLCYDYVTHQQGY